MCWNLLDSGFTSVLNSYIKLPTLQVRISTMVAADGGRFRGKVPQWRHAKCFLSMGHFSGPLASLPGWDTLTSEDQAQVQTLAKPSAGNRLLECSAFDLLI